MRATKEVMRVQIPCLPLFQYGSMVKRTSCLASNERFQVRILVGLLMKNRKGNPIGDGSRLEPGGACPTCLEGSTPSPSACLQNGSMVKRKSSLASNQKFRVRFLVGLLPKYAVTLAAGIIPLH